MAESKHDPFRTINPPIHRASTVLYETYESFLEADQAPYHGTLYGTFGSPVQLELEKALAALEGGYACRVCHSGFDAIGVVPIRRVLGASHRAGLRRSRDRRTSGGGRPALERSDLRSCTDARESFRPPQGSSR